MLIDFVTEENLSKGKLRVITKRIEFEILENLKDKAPLACVALRGTMFLNLQIHKYTKYTLRIQSYEKLGASLNRLVSYCNKYKIFTENQHGMPAAVYLYY